MLEWVTDFERFREHYADFRVLILSPIGHCEPRWVECVADMMAFSWDRGLKIFEMGKTERQVVHWARNELAKESLKRDLPQWSGETGKYTHFLWLDDDHIFWPNLACKLANNFINPVVDMVSATYVNRYNPDVGGDCYVVAYVKDSKKHYNRDDPRDWMSAYPIVKPPASLIEIDSAGFGAMMMKREVLEKVGAEPFQFVHGGEDFAFCRKAKDAGVRIFLDGTTRIGHIGTAPVMGLKHHEQFIKDHGFEDQVKYKFNEHGGNNG